MKWESKTSGLNLTNLTGFYDIDGDNVKEAIFLDRVSNGIYIINPQNNLLEFTLKDVNFKSVLDIDNDGLPELIVNDISGSTDSNTAQIWGNGTTIRVGLNPSKNPVYYKLSQNYPNPFNPITTIEYSVQKNGLVQINIYNSVGQLVRTVVNEEKSMGEYSAIWDGKNNNGEKVTSGIYFYQLKVGDYTSTNKMILLK